MTPLWKFSFTVPYEAVDAFSDALEAAFFPEALAVSTCEAEPGSSPLVKTASEWNEVEAHGIWRVEALYDEEPALETLRKLIEGAQQETGIEPAALAIEPLPDEDWVTRSLEGLEPVRAGRFFVYGSHDADKLPEGRIGLLIEAAMAFGTGHHGTTLGCLRALDRLAEAGFQGRNVIDVGCGTAVLAMAAARLWPDPVLASDIDEVAVEVAEANVQANDLQGRVECLEAVGFDHPTIKARAPFDLVFANILKGPLIALAPDMARYTAPGGHAILSGLLVTQADDVLATYTAQGFTLHHREDIGEWSILTLTRD